MKNKGFTLAELLLALVILGVIATFTIPKVLSSQQDTKFRAVAKEAVASVSNAVEILRAKGSLSSTTRVSQLTPYLNYVRVDTVTTIDDDYDGGTDSCSAGGRDCLQLHNGAMIFYKTSEQFDSTDNTSALWFRLDPDGKMTGTGAAGGPGMAIEFLIYYNGRVLSQANYLTGSVSSWGAYPADTSADPPWFSWN